MKIRLLIILLFSFTFLFCIAQRGKDGAKTISSAATIVNEYTKLTANASAGSTSITVAGSGLNSSGRFPGPLSEGDLIMIIQVQGASILTDVQTKEWGKILNYNNCGSYEFAQVLSVPNSTTINIECALVNNYTASGRTEVIRVPRYTSLTINNGGELTGETWDGAKGGVCVVEVLGSTVINSGGKMNMTGKGLRGGVLNDNHYFWGVGEYYSLNDTLGAEKGEGIAGFETDYDALGGRYCRGAPANGGGGANTHNHGGGGGANAGDTALWTGQGNPDVSDPTWIQAWNLEGADFAYSTSSGGGRGGYSFSDSTLDPLILGPYNVTLSTAWKGDFRRWCGGLGGRPLDNSTGRIFMGGGGGAGEQNDSKGSSGANGGGIIFIQSYGNVSGSGQVISNGAAAANSTSGSGIFGDGGADGAGGGGGGGTIIIKSTGTSGGITANANGGKGGDQVITPLYLTITHQAEGPGGGGSGGYIAISNGSVTSVANGGTNGTTNSSALTEFPPNGATKGGAGISNASISAFYIDAPNDTICSGNSAALTATIMGTPPQGAIIYWYDAIAGGNMLGTGHDFTTPLLTATTTYYVGTCPGTYHQPVTVVVNNFSAEAGPDVSVCSGGSVTLNASGGVSYSWSAGISNPYISNPTASPVNTTIYYVTVTNSYGCHSVDSVKVTVGSNLVISVTPGTSTICPGASVQLTAYGAQNYSWSPATDLSATTGQIVNATPLTTTTYIINGTDGSGCSGSTTITVNVDPLNATTTSTNESCGQSNGSATVLPSGTCTEGFTYLWNTVPQQSTSTAFNIPSGTYIVTVFCGSCNTTATAVVASNAGLSLQISNILNASCAQSDGGASSTPIGGTSPYVYAWSNGQTTQNLTAVSAGTYSLTVHDANGCSVVSTVSIPSSNGLSANIAGVINASCNQDNGSATVNVEGGTQPYTYNWNSIPPQTSQNLQNASAGNYIVTATDAGGCSATANVTITQTGGPVVTVTALNEDCNMANGSAIATVSQGTGSYSYTWSTTPPQTSNIATGLSFGAYTVTVNDGVCSITTGVNVFGSQGPTAGFTVQPSMLTIYNGDATFYDNSSGNIVNWQWNFGDGNSSASGSTVTHIFNNIGTYLVTLIVTDDNGCSDTYIDTVIVNDIFTIYVPNAFTPDGDGINDIFFPKGINIESGNYELTIYDRWGNLTFKTTNLEEGWNGTYMNKGDVLHDIIMDVYVYKISLSDKNGLTHQYLGRVAILQ